MTTRNAKTSDVLGILPLQDAVRVLPNLRSLPGAILVIALVLYPYVYLSARAMFQFQTAEFAEDIDLERAQAALKRAQERITKGGEDIDWDRATLSLQRALVRIQVVFKHQGVDIASAR